MKKILIFIALIIGMSILPVLGAQMTGKYTLTYLETKDGSLNAERIAAVSLNDTIEFLDRNKCKVFSPLFNVTDEYTYKLEGNKLTIIEKFDIEKVGTFDGKKITFIDESDGEKKVFEKQ